MPKVMPSTCTNSRQGMKRISESCLIFFIFQIQVCSMASKAQLQLQSVKEITQEMPERGAGGISCGNRQPVQSPEFLVQMGSQARSKLEEEKRKIIISLCMTWIGIIAPPSFSTDRGPADMLITKYYEA